MTIGYLYDKLIEAAGGSVHADPDINLVTAAMTLKSQESEIWALRDQIIHLNKVLDTQNADISILRVRDKQAIVRSHNNAIEAAAILLENSADDYSCGCDSRSCRCAINREQMRIDADLVRELRKGQ